MPYFCNQNHTETCRSRCSSFKNALEMPVLDKTACSDSVSSAEKLNLMTKTWQTVQETSASRCSIPQENKDFDSGLIIGKTLNGMRERKKMEFHLKPNWRICFSVGQVTKSNQVSFIYVAQNNITLPQWAYQPVQWTASSVLTLLIRVRKNCHVEGKRNF